MKGYQLILVSLLLSACADNGYAPVALDANYGRSIRQVTQAQYLNPQAAANPSTEAYKKLDGQVGQSIMNSYRSGFRQSEQIEGITINVGGSSSSSGSSSGN